MEQSSDGYRIGNFPALDHCQCFGQRQFSNLQVFSLIEVGLALVKVLGNKNNAFFVGDGVAGMHAQDLRPAFCRQTARCRGPC